MRMIPNFDEVTTGSERLEPGAYIIKILSATDNPSEEYLDIVWDVAEGQHADHFGGKTDNAWSHSFRMYYRQTCLGMFKGFIEKVETCNPGFAWTWNERELVGKKLGVVFDKRLYTKRDGGDGDMLERGAFYSLDYVRDGKARAWKTVDNREQKSTYAQHVSAPAADDVPFF